MKIGFAEIVIISIVAFMALGPEKFPQFAKMIGRMLKEVKILTRDLSKEIRESVTEPLEDVGKMVKEPISFAAAIPEQGNEQMDGEKTQEQI